MAARSVKEMAVKIFFSDFFFLADLIAASSLVFISLFLKAFLLAALRALFAVFVTGIKYFIVIYRFVSII